MLAGTGLVEAGTYIAILFGTILAGWVPVEWAAALVVIIAVVGYFTSNQVPPAPPEGEKQPIDRNIIRSSIQLIRNTTHDREVFYAILAISFFWTIGAVLFIQFPPLAKNVLYASKEVASLFLVMFSIGVAIGSISINALLKGKVSARYAPDLGDLHGDLRRRCSGSSAVRLAGDHHLDRADGRAPNSSRTRWRVAVLVTLLLIAISGGMFVVPLYAFLTTKVEPNQAARTVAANNIVNSGAMVIGSLTADRASAH